jgi:hypothetical protein
MNKKTMALARRPAKRPRRPTTVIDAVPVEQESIESRASELIKVAMAQYLKRKKVNAGKEKIDNAKLHAGSPMYYYCRYCGDHTETLPESHLSKPKTTCDSCKLLVNLGLLTR